MKCPDTSILVGIWGQTLNDCLGTSKVVAVEKALDEKDAILQEFKKKIFWGLSNHGKGPWL